MKVPAVQVIACCILPLIAVVNTEESCSAEQYYYKEGKLSCWLCGEDAEWNKQENRCECRENYRTIARLDEYNVTCKKCEPLQIPSIDGWGCTERQNESCNIEEFIEVDRSITGSLLKRECLKCDDGTLPDMEKHRCVPCPTYADGHFCPFVCPDNFQHNGEEVGPSHLFENYTAIVYKCKELSSRKACNFLLNLCSLRHYSSCEKINDGKLAEWGMPSFEPAEEKDKDDLSTKYSFKHYQGKNSKLGIKVARYSVDGQLLGISDAGVQMLKVCGGQDQKDDTPFMFGVWCSETCYTLSRTLQRSWKTEFYELFIADEKKTRRIPVIIQHLNTGRLLEKSKIKYTYRFFLVDNVSGRKAEGKDADVVQYASNIKLSISQAKGDEEAGRITIPVLMIQYEAVKGDIKNDSSFVKSEFSIEYWMDYEDKEEEMSIAVGVLSVFAILYSGIETWSWSKRSGRIAIDVKTLFKLVLYVCGNLANVFLLVIYSATLLRLVYYKEQDTAEMMLPTSDQERPFRIYVIAAFCLKTVDLFHMVITQVNMDVFFIDWERPMFLSGASGTPHPQPSLPPVSIWRTYFIANEWNKMQTSRKTCSSLNFIVLLLLLKVFSLEDIALARPSGVEQITQLCSPFSSSSRFAVAVSFFFAIAFIQLVFRKFVRERYYVDILIQFTDVCSVSNISVFVLEHAQFGYYIHGQSVYGNADIDMKGFSEQLKREQNNLCSQRGLLPNTTLQTFKVFITKDFQRQCRKIMQPFTRAPESHSRLHFTVSLPSFPNGPGVTLDDQLILSYKTMNKFLATFIDHALQDLDYIIKDRLPSERLLDVEFLEPMDKTFFYNDPLHSFSRVLFYGQEIRLLIWEILLICLVDLVAQDFVLAVVITYMCTKVVQFVRHHLGERNIIRKSLLDGRFILR